MKANVVLVVARVVFAIAYVWLVRETYLFTYSDICVDAGGVVDGDSGLCLSARADEAVDLGARAPLIFWLVLLGLPALVVWDLHSLLVAGVRSVWPSSPNKTMEPTR